jgi:hypothetical protein
MRSIPAGLPELATYGSAPDRDTIELLRTLVLGVPLSDPARVLVEVACAEGVDRGLVRLLPLLHRHPAAAGLDSRMRRRIEREHRLAGLRFVVLERTARRLIEKLRPAGMVPLFLKGYPLASRVYASPALRPMGDLDLAVGAGQFERACDLMREMGYEEKVDRPMAMGPGRHAATFKHPVGAQIVDLHQFVLSFSRWPGADERFWARSEALPVGGASALTLAAEDHLLLTCLHGYAHHPAQMPFRWMVDACLLLARAGDGFRWQVLLAESGRQRCEGVLGAALGFLAHHFDAPVPAEVLSRLASAPPRPHDDAYFRLHGRLTSPSVALRLRVFWASFRRQEDRARAGPLAILRWAGRRWERRSIPQTLLEGLRRLPRAKTDRLKQGQGAGMAAHTRRLKATLAARRPP